MSFQSAVIREELPREKPNAGGGRKRPHPLAWLSFSERSIASDLVKGSCVIGWTPEKYAADVLSGKWLTWRDNTDGERYQAWLFLHRVAE